MIQIFSSYSQKLLTLTLLISIFPIVVFGILFYIDKIDDELNSIKNLLTMSAEDKAEHVSDWLQERKINVIDIAHNSIIISETKKLLDEDSDEQKLFEAKFSIEKQLSVSHQNHEWLSDLRIIDPKTGDVIFYTGLSAPKYNLKYQNHFIEATKGNTVFSDIYPSLEIIKNEFGNFEKGVPTLLISSPIQSEVGIEAILTARIDVFEIENLFAKHELENFVSIEEYLVNSNGFLLSKTNSFPALWKNNLIEKRTELELSIGDILFDETLTRILDSGYREVGWNEGYDNFLGERVVGVSVPVEGTNWMYITEINHNEAFYETALFQLILLSLIGVTLLSVSGISLFFSSKLTLPIKNLIRVIDQIKKGNLKVNVKTCGNDEIHDLAVSFNSMAKTLQKSSEAEKAILKKFKDLYENSPTLNRTINLTGKILNCNKSYADAFGYKKEEIIGKTIYDFVPKNQKNEIKESFENWKKTGETKNRELVFQRKDGSLFPGIISANNLYDKKGVLIGSNTTIQDLSDIRSAQKEIQKLQTKRLSVIGELTARIAHDMRNPLSVIKNSAELIKLEIKDSNKDIHKHFSRLDRGIYRITHQVEDVLDYVRVPEIKRKETNFSSILIEAIDRCEIPENIKINIKKSSGKIFCDSERLEIVLVNLFMNAIQAMGMNKGIIDITYTENYQNRYSLIEISDTGPGIPKELINKIFDPLFTTRQIGTGLGLPSCKNIVEYHYGTIDVKSKEGKGTTFTIKIPSKSEFEQIPRIADKEKLTDFITSLQSQL